MIAVSDPCVFYNIGSKTSPGRNREPEKLKENKETIKPQPDDDDSPKKEKKNSKKKG